MGIFDGSNRDQCEVRRGRTNTPLQALAMLNDPTVLEAARVLAQRLEGETSSADEKIAKAFRTILCRKPTASEQQRLVSYYKGQLAIFQNDHNAAQKTLTVGEYPWKEGIDIIACAALMRVIDTMYNLEETITKT